MKRPLAVVLLCGSLWPAPGHSEIVERYDEFEGEYLVETRLVASEDDAPKLILRAAYKRARFDGDFVREATVSFSRTGDDWRWLGCHRWAWLVDSARTDLGETIHEGRVGTGFVLELVANPSVPFATVKKLASAKEVRVKVCNDAWTLSNAEMADLRRFVELLTPKK